MRPRAPLFLVLALTLGLVAAALALPPEERPVSDRPGPPGGGEVPPPTAPPLPPGERPGEEEPLLPPPGHCLPGESPLSAAEVDTLLTQAALAVAGDYTVAVADRAGRPLGVFRKGPADGGRENRALGLARTAAFFSNNQAPLSSRTVRFVSGVHFPPGVARTANAALYGIENTNRGCGLNAGFLPGRDVPPAEALGGGFGSGPVTGKPNLCDDHGPCVGSPNHRPSSVAVDPGGVPIYRGAFLVGGLGVAGLPGEQGEFAAIAAISAAGFSIAPSPLPAPGVVFIDGIRLPLVKQTTRPAGTSPQTGPLPGAYVVAPTQGFCVPEGDLVAPAGAATLSAAEVQTIVNQSVAAANRTRAVIRLPLGSRARMAIAVTDTQGKVLALHRMRDSTVFSLDVAVAKARNVVHFSTVGLPPEVPPGTAVTNRTLGFGAQPLFPPGIDGTAPGPFYNLFLQDSNNPCALGGIGLNTSGIVFFAGSVPLYRNGQLVGGLGISGDGVEQDDYVSFLGAQGFLPPEAIRADRLKVRGVRLPFLKFPRNPEG